MTRPINREDWLHRVAVVLEEELFKPSDYFVPRNIRYSVGFPSKNGTSRNRTTIGQCWSSSASKDNHFEIFINPRLGDKRTIVATLLHEMVHAVVGLENGHNKVFKRCALDVGLTGKMTATTMNDDTWQYLEQKLHSLGNIPHAELKISNAKKKQTTRMVKVSCLNGCNYHYRQSRTMFESVQSHCPICDARMGAPE